MRRSSTRTGLLATAAMCFAGLACADTGSFNAGYVSRESGGVVGITSTNPNSTSVGLGQMNEGALSQVGLLTNVSPRTSAQGGANGTWSNATVASNPFGITSEADFRANGDAQQYYLTKYENYTWRALQGSTSYVGQPIPGVPGSTITNASIEECGMILGAAGCASYLANPNGTQGANAIGNNVAARMQAAAGEDVSSITGAADSTQASGTSVAIAPGQGNSVGIYCAPAIAAMQAGNGAQAVSDWVGLAGRADTGYTTINGQGLFDAAGLNSAVAPILGTSAFGRLSCLNNLLGQGLNIMFAPPSMGDILGAIAQAVCNEAQNLFAQAVQPLNQSLYESTGNITGGFMPGLNLGSIGGGVNAGVGNTNGGGLLNVGEAGAGTLSSQSAVALMNGDTTWYTRAPSFYQPSVGYGSIIGPPQGAATSGLLNSLGLGGYLP